MNCISILKRTVQLPKGLRNFAAMVKAQKFVYVKEFVGEPNSSNFELVEEDLPEIKNGEFLVKAEYLSVDPYMRAYMVRYPTGVTMIGGQVAK